MLIVLMFPRALPGAQTHGLVGEIRWGSPEGRLATLLSPLACYQIGGEVGLAAALVCAIAWLARKGALNVHRGLLDAAGALALLALLSPTFVAGAGWLDGRFPIMAMLCALAATMVKTDAPARPPWRS